MPIKEPAPSKRFEEALSYAATLHSEQKRKGTDIPYIAHLMAVCALLLEQGGDEDQAIAALLHNAVEDRDGKPTLEEIRQGFIRPRSELRRKILQVRGITGGPTVTEASRQAEKD